MRFLPLLALLPAVHAYAVFDEVIPPEPQWMVPPLGSVAGDAAVIYRIVRAGDDQAWIEAMSRTDAALVLRWVVPGYSDAPAELAVAPGGIARAAIRLRKCDHGLLSAAVAAAGQAQPPRPAALPTAYGVTASVEDAGFAAHLLAYTLSPAASGGIDLHVRHSGDRPVHLDWRVVGRPALATPRLHLLPGRTAEVVLAGVVDAGIANEIVEVSNVRIGPDDSGPLRSAGAAFGRRFTATRPGDGWLTAIPADERQIAFNPFAVAWRPKVQDNRLLGIDLRNRSTQRLTVRWVLPGIHPGGMVSLASEEERTLPLGDLPWPPNRVRELHLTGIEIDGLPLAGNWTSAAPKTLAGAFPVTPIVADPRFNPLQLVYQTRPVAGAAQVTLVNLHGVAVHADVRLAGYQQQSQRISLAAGATTVLTVAVAKADLRLATARLEVAQVRLGDDQGEAWCGAFTSAP